MNYRSLGRTGMQVSPLCLGAMMFGAWGGPDHETSIGSSTARWTPASTLRDMRADRCTSARLAAITACAQRGAWPSRGAVPKPLCGDRLVPGDAWFAAIRRECLWAAVLMDALTCHDGRRR